MPSEGRSSATGGHELPAVQHTKSAASSTHELPTVTRSGTSSSRPSAESSMNTSSVDGPSSLDMMHAISSTRSFVLPLEFEDSSLRRGTTLADIFSGFFKHLKMASNASDKDLAALAELSRQVPHLDEFVSHAWRDGRSYKICALCLYYNGFPAAVLSILAGVVAFFLTVAGILPVWQQQEWYHDGVYFTEWVSHWPSVIGTPVFFIALLTWHHAPRWLGGGRGRALFFDKLCIDQRNRDRQNQGIQSLSAFIACSDHFLLLWSSNYFTRLWCTFEMATFAHIHAPGRTRHGSGGGALVFKQLEMAMHAMAITATFVWCTWTFDAVCMATAVYETDPMLVLFASEIVPAILFSPVHMHFWRKAARAQVTLASELATFEIESAGCSKEEDRESIYFTIEHWFGSRSKFNTLVRTDMRKRILDSISGDYGLPPLSVTAYTMLPFLFSTLDWSISYINFEDVEFGTSCIIFSASLIFIPIALSDMMFILGNAKFFLKPRASKACDRLLTFIASIPGLLYYTLWTVANIVFVRQTGPLPQFGSFCCMLAFMATMRMLFRRSRARPT